MVSLPGVPPTLPPPDDLATEWCRWWWLGATTSLVVSPSGVGVLTWSIDDGAGPWCQRARAFVDARTVAAIEHELHSRGCRPTGTGD